MHLNDIFPMPNWKLNFPPFNIHASIYLILAYVGGKCICWALKCSKVGKAIDSTSIYYFTYFHVASHCCRAEYSDTQNSSTQEILIITWQTLCFKSFGQIALFTQKDEWNTQSTTIWKTTHCYSFFYRDVARCKFTCLKQHCQLCCMAL